MPEGQNLDQNRNYQIIAARYTALGREAKSAYLFA
jgi:hypothetical protein